MKTYIQLRNSALVVSAITAGTAYASTDYGPAIWNPPCNANYYTSGNGHKFHVVHDMEGYYESTVSMFNGCGYTSASVHYLTNAKSDYSGDASPGAITQMVRDSYYAWHVKCWNTHCTGTEHEGFRSNPAWYNEAQYKASAGITKHLSDKFGWAKDRNHVVGHDEERTSAWVTYARANLGIDPTCNTHDDPGPYWDWGHYMELVKGSISLKSIAAIKNTAGNLEVFVVGKDGDLYHKWYDPTNSWSGWSTLGGNFAQDASVCVVTNHTGNLEIFMIGKDSGELFHNYQSGGVGGTWSGWVGLGGTFYNDSKIAAAINTGGYLEIFIIGKDGDLYHKWYRGSATGWSDWYSLGGNGPSTVGWLSVTRNSAGNLEVFMVGANSKELWHNWYNPSNSWSGWYSMGGSWSTDNKIVALQNNLGNAEVFMVGNDADLYHNWYTGSGWSGWSSLAGNGPANGSMAVVKNHTGNLEAFMVGASSKELWHTWKDSDTGSWTGWSSLGGTWNPDKSDVAAAINTWGYVEVFMVGTNGDLWHKWYRGATGWSDWYSLGGDW